jgi:hypothetical protein
MHDRAVVAASCCFCCCIFYQACYQTACIGALHAISANWAAFTCAVATFEWRPTVSAGQVFVAQQLLLTTTRNAHGVQKAKAFTECRHTRGDNSLLGGWRMHVDALASFLHAPSSLSLAPDWGSHSLLGEACKVK